MSVGSPLRGKGNTGHPDAMFTYRQALVAGMAVLGAATLEPSSGEAIDARRDPALEVASRRAATDVTASAGVNVTTFHAHVLRWSGKLENLASQPPQGAATLLWGR